jgi:hypothetical protein
MMDEVDQIANLSDQCKQHLRLPHQRLKKKQIATEGPIKFQMSPKSSGFASNFVGFNNKAATLRLSSTRYCKMGRLREGKLDFASRELWFLL